MSFLVELPENQYASAAFGEFSSRPEFNLGTARAMAWMSQLAYETRLPDKIAQIAKLWGLQNVRRLQRPAKSTLPLSSTHGLLATKDNALIVSFAGTDPLNLVNWISDFYLGRPTADVHQGFCDAAVAVWDEVGAAIESCIRSDQPLFVTGHSLGAAIALVTVEMARKQKQLAHAEIYLFGSPRVGRADFVKSYNDHFGMTTYRLVHGNDVVATVPPSELGFHHVGRLLQCERGRKFDGTRLLGDAQSDEPAPGNDFFSGITERGFELFSGPLSPTARTDALGQLSQFLVRSIGDHLPDRYYGALTP